jgi:hypothetical protein
LRHVPTFEKDELKRLNHTLTQFTGVRQDTCGALLPRPRSIFGKSPRFELIAAVYPVR